MSLYTSFFTHTLAFRYILPERITNKISVSLLRDAYQAAHESQYLMGTRQAASVLG